MIISNDDYKLIPQEIILPQSSLSPEYYKELVPFASKKYGRKKTFETANPKITIATKKNAWTKEIVV